MKNLLFLCALLSSINNISSAQGWERSYTDSSGTSMGRDAIQTYDRGFIFTSVNGGFTSQGLTAKLDANGNVIWSSTVGGFSLVETVDSGYIVLSSLFSSFELNKIDGFGNVLWSKVHSLSGGQNHFGFINNVEDGGFIACGAIGCDAVIVRLDSNGDTLWTFKSNNTDCSIFSEIVETNDHGFLAAGNIDSAGNSTTYLVKTDSTGNVIWSKTHSYSTAKAVCKTYDNGFVTAGGFGPIIKFDSTGNVLWITNFVNDYTIRSIRQTFDHGFILTGNTWNFNGDYKILLIKLDSNGDSLWTKTYDHGPDMDAAESVNLVTDGGFVLCGYINFGSPLDVNAYVIRTDSLGNTYTNTISGNIYYDMNSNCVFDSLTDFPARNVLVIGNGINGNFASFTDSSGYYNMHVGIGSYNISQQLPLYRTQLCPTAPALNVSFSNANNDTSGFDFYDIMIPGIHDLRINITAGPFRPGINANYWLNYKNMGTSTESGEIVLNIDSNIVFNSSIPPPDSVYINKYIWNYSNLQLEAEQEIYILANVPSITPIGTLLFSNTSIGSIPMDSNPSDNIDYVDHFVTGSFDPNQKVSFCSDQDSTGGILTNDTLEYTIFFQNTGTDTAFSISIEDVFDMDLDVNTFQMLGSSHSYSLQPVTLNTFRWVFNNILLPDSNVNELESHGFIRFSIRPKSNLTTGTEITNQANIFFDFNSPVATNTTINTIRGPLGINHENYDSHYRSFIYPNPFYTETIYHYENMHDATISIYNCFGVQVLQENNIHGNWVKISRGNLKSGIYFIKLFEGNKVLAFDKLVIVD